MGGRDGCRRPFFIMLKSSVLIICGFCCIVTLGGCATHFMNVKDAREVHTYDDLKRMFGENINCRKIEYSRECFFHYDSFDLFSLENRSQSFYFHIDKNDQITDRKIDEVFTEYHIMPPTKLPDSFKEFE
jgi:hypothetical protein